MSEFALTQVPLEPQRYRIQKKAIPAFELVAKESCDEVCCGMTDECFVSLGGL
jgi:hypothetical protein